MIINIRIFSLFLSNILDFCVVKCGEKGRHGLWYHMHRVNVSCNNLKYTKEDTSDSIFLSACYIRKSWI